MRSHSFAALGPLRLLLHLTAILVASISLWPAPGDEHWDVQFGWPGTNNNVHALAIEGGKVYASRFYSTPAVAETNFVEVWDLQTNSVSPFASFEFFGPMPPPRFCRVCQEGKSRRGQGVKRSTHLGERARFNLIAC